jgi:hypothetical protein
VSSADVTSLVREKVAELSTRSEPDAWAACAAVWARAFVLATPGWRRWPDLGNLLGEALGTTLLVVPGATPAPPGLIERLESFDVEDDGSAEWQYAIDVAAMLLSALGGDPLPACATATLTTYLEGTFNVVANNLAMANGRPISQLEAVDRVPESDTWRRAVAFVQSL